jgi:hypothetical protein
MDTLGDLVACVCPPSLARALGLPEILFQVLGMLEDDPKTLANAIRVNSMWLDCGVPKLWQHSPADALGRVDPHRRQMYASRIVRLEFLGPTDVPSGQLGLEFPRLYHIINKCRTPLIFSILTEMPRPAVFAD